MSIILFCIVWHDERYQRWKCVTCVFVCERETRNEAYKSVDEFKNELNLMDLLSL